MGSTRNEMSSMLCAGSVSRIIRQSESSLKLGDLVPRADIPDVDTSSEVAKPGTEQQSTLRLVEEDITVS